jgi:hypothetical protein
MHYTGIFLYCKHISTTTTTSTTFAVPNKLPSKVLPYMTSGKNERKPIS